MIKIDDNTLNRLFKSDYFKISNEEFTQLEQLAHSILKKYSLDEVYENFDRYLRCECKTEDDVINFVHFFVHYNGLKFQIPSQYDPYDLVGYILSMVDLEKRWDDCGGLFDDFANQALRIDLYHDPYYQFWRDPKILAIAEKYKEKKNGLR